LLMLGQLSDRRQRVNDWTRTHTAPAVSVVVASTSAEDELSATVALTALVASVSSRSRGGGPQRPVTHGPRRRAASINSIDDGAAGEKMSA
jgi:hypothetical protein